MKPLENRRILLIGGAGFIGHHLALTLKDLGAKVRIIDNLYHNNYYALKEKNKSLVSTAELYLHIIQQRLSLLKEKNIELQEIDARNYRDLTLQFVQFQPDTVIQLAAIAHAGIANKDPYTTFDNSLRTLENALDASRSTKLNVKHFIYFSSSMVYGNFQTSIVTEDTPCEPLGIYGALKFSGEKMVIAYQQVFGLSYTIIRPSALYGERCVSRRVGQLFIESAFQGLDIAVEGDGSDRLDFTYIGDLVNGIVCVLKNEQAKNQIFNMTYGGSRSISEMIAILRDVFPQIRIKTLPRDTLTPYRGTLSITKAKNLLGYSPIYPLEVGFIHYIEWYKELFEEYPTHGS